MSQIYKKKSKLKSKKAGMFSNAPAKVLKEFSNVFNAVLRIYGLLKY